MERARIVLLAAEGCLVGEIAERVGCSEPTVIRWRSRFAEHGMAGLADEPRPGKPPTIPPAVRDEILAITLTEPPTERGITHWSSRLLAARLRRDGKPVLARDGGPGLEAVRDPAAPLGDVQALHRPRSWTRRSATSSGSTSLRVMSPPPWAPQDEQPGAHEKQRQA